MMNNFYNLKRLFFRILLNLETIIKSMMTLTMFMTLILFYLLQNTKQNDTKNRIYTRIEFVLNSFYLQFEN